MLCKILRDAKTGNIAVSVAYGTSNLKLDMALPLQIYVRHPRDLEEGGLSVPMRFDLELTKTLPWCEEFFAEINKGEGPVIGRLSAVCRLELRDLIKAHRAAQNRT